jgi:UDP-2,3-diacylglucosamine pyrophosphatase LpxH
MITKAKVIVSDLHIGAGFAPDNPLEDFITDVEFAEFLSRIVTESDAKKMDVELIVNGDMFEFLQVPAEDDFDPRAIYPPELYHASSEGASVEKMVLIVRGHLTFFAALRNFINVGDPRRSITIVKGNHDVALYWSGVQDVVRRVIDATGDRQELLIFEAQRVSREGVYVEHGNQYVEKVNRFDDFEEPLDPKHPGELETPAGSIFVMDFVTSVEREKWWVDSVKPITALIWYGFAIDFAFAAQALVEFLKVAPVLIVGSFADEEGDGVGARMDELRRQLEDQAQVAALAERYAASETFCHEFNAQVARILRTVDAPPEVMLSAAVGGTDALDRGRDAAALADIALRQVAQAKINEEHAQVVVFGHTHRPLCEQLDGGVYLNSGMWVWWRDLANADLDTWKEFYAHPERFTQPHYLTYVRVDYDERGRPHARLLDYTGQLVVECSKPYRCKIAAWLVAQWEKWVLWFAAVFGKK